MRTRIQPRMSQVRAGRNGSRQILLRLMRDQSALSRNAVSSDTAVTGTGHWQLFLIWKSDRWRQDVLFDVKCIAPSEPFQSYYTVTPQARLSGLVSRR